MNAWSFGYLRNLDEEQISRCFSVEGIAKIEKYCKEAEEDLKVIRQKLFEQAQKLQSLKVDKFIEVERKRNYSDKRVTVWVRVYTVRTLDDVTIHESDYNTIKEFTGLQKKQALAYASELQKQTGLRIVKENWK